MRFLLQIGLAVLLMASFVFAAYSADEGPKYLDHWASYDEGLAQSVSEEIRLDDINVAMDCMLSIIPRRP